MVVIDEIPPWADSPRFDYRLFKDRVKMGQSYRSFMVNLRKFLISKSDEEPGGTKYVRHEGVFGTAGYVHEIPTLPTSHGYFIVVLYPPPDVDDGALEGSERPVELLFSVNSLYYLGYDDGEFWQVFKDALLVGVSKESEEGMKIKRLTIKGSYQGIGVDFDGLIIGFQGQLETQRTLAIPSWANKTQLKRVSCRNVVGISESMRFQFLLKLHLTNFHMGYTHATMDAPVKVCEKYRNPSEHLNDWSNYSGKCREGREKFENKKLPIPGIPSFQCLLNFMVVLSNKEHDKNHQIETSENKKQESDKKEGDKKEGGNEDPQDDKDGKEQQKRNSSSSVWFFESPVMPYRWTGGYACLTMATKDVSHSVFGPAVKQRWSSAFTKQLIERPIFAEGADNNLQLTVVRPFNCIGPRMEFITGLAVPGEGVHKNLLRREPLKLVVERPFNCTGPNMEFIPGLAVSSESVHKNLFRREPLKLVDSVEQRTFGFVIDAINTVILMMVMYCWENNKRLIDICTCVVCGMTTSSFLPKDHSLCKEPEFCMLKDEEASCVFTTQIIKRLAEAAENNLQFMIQKPFNWIGPRIDFISGVDGPRESAPQENPARAKVHRSSYGNPISDVSVRDLAGRMGEVYASVSGEPPLKEHLIDVSTKQFYSEGHDISGWNPKNPVKGTTFTTCTRLRRKLPGGLSVKFDNLTFFGCTPCDATHLSCTSAVMAVT